MAFEALGLLPGATLSPKPSPIKGRGFGARCSLRYGGDKETVTGSLLSRTKPISEKHVGFVSANIYRRSDSTHISVQIVG